MPATFNAAYFTSLYFSLFSDVPFRACPIVPQFAKYCRNVWPINLWAFCANEQPKHSQTQLRSTQHNFFTSQKLRTFKTADTGDRGPQRRRYCSPGYSKLLEQRQSSGLHLTYNVQCQLVHSHGVQLLLPVQGTG